MPRVLFASVDTLPDIGGVSIMTHHLANALTDQGHQVYVFGGEASSITPWEPRYEILQDSHFSPRDREGPLWSERELPRLATTFRSLVQDLKIDRAIATHCFYYAPPLQAVCKDLNVPFSTYIHGFELRSQLRLKERWRSLRMRRNGNAPSLSDVTINLVRSADEILVNSHYTRDLVKQVRKHGPTMVVGCGIEAKHIPNPTSPSILDRESIRERVFRRLHIPQSTRTVGTLCRLVPNKNVRSLIGSLEHLNDTHALIIGEGPERSELENLAERLGLNKRVHFLGAVDELEKWELLHAIDVFCLLSRTGSNGEVEGFGISMLEAAVAGCAVVSSGMGGMSDIVSSEETGQLVRSKSPKSVARAINKLLENPELRLKLASRLQEQISTKFNWTMIASSLDELWFSTDSSEL